MKKIVSLFLVLMLALSVSAFAEEPASENPPSSTQGNEKCGILTMLNVSEEEYAHYLSVRPIIRDWLIKDGYTQAEVPADGDVPTDPEGGIVYYDTLNAMLMGLEAGEIGFMEVYQSVGRYLASVNDRIQLYTTYDLNKERSLFAQNLFSRTLGNDFAFLMMEDRAELRDQFNEAIASMKADGTLDRLIQEQIEDVIAGGEARVVTMPETEGAPVVRVAVTGDLPPMDYVSADGTPAGFNTAVLAEIGSRTGLNIQLVIVDGYARSSALASGTVDAVFWTRTSAEEKRVHSLSKEEIEEYYALITAEELAVVEKLQELHLSDPAVPYYAADMPEGTIATDAYYSDVTTLVGLKTAAAQ